MDALLKKLQTVEAQFGQTRKVAEKFAATTKDVGAAAAQAGKGAEKGSVGIGKFGASIMRIVKYRMIRAAIRNIMQAFQEGLENVKEFSAGLEGEGHRIAQVLGDMSNNSLKMKNQLGSAFAEILSAIAPVINQIVSWLTTAANAISQFFAALGGNSRYYKAVDATAEVAKNLGGGAKSAKEIRNQLMGYDVINRLDKPNEGGGGGGGSVLDQKNNMFEYTEISTGIRKIAETIKKNLPLIEVALGASELALGALLTFSGANIPVGLGLMAIGAATLATALKEDWGAVPANVQEAVLGITIFVSGALLGIGAVLLFSGANIPLGLGLIAAGLAGYATVGVSWGKLTPELQGQITAIMTMISTALVVLGVIFLFTGMIPIGLGLLLAGGIAAGATVALNWDALKDKLKETWDGIKTWWETHVKKYFTREYWQEKINSMFDITPPHIPMPHFEVTWEPAGALASFFGFNAVPRIGVNFYAAGGFPEDGLFMANHGELVGQFSNGNTAVANNEQIIAGIERGVYNAVTSAMANKGGNESVVKVFLDGKQISNAVTRNQRSTERATGVALA